MARAKKYSGIDWIGLIPEQWRISKIKYVADFDPSCDCSSLTPDTMITYTPMENIKNGYYIPNSAAFGSLASSLTAYQENDIVMAKVTPCFENGNIAIMSGLDSGVGLGSSELFVFRPTKIQTRYLFYWLQNKAFVEQAKATMTGTGGLKRVSPQFIRNCFLHCPPTEEQARIADFLDSECAQIDAVIDQTRASIEEYKKLKQAVITQAVTKGIRPNRPMKDSGITWVGEIPSKWRISKFKWEARVVANLVDPEAYEDYQQIAPDSIEPASGRIIVHRTVKDANVISWNQLFQKGQILYSKIRPALNKVAIAPYDGLCSADMYPIETNHDVRFFLYLMLSDYFVSQVDLITRDRVKMPKINQEELSRIVLIIPDLKEQEAIVEYLDKKCAELDKLILSKENCVKELESYKKSLIFEYVTGKKEVV